MKLNFLQKVPVTRFLVIFFSTILIFLIISEVIDYKKFRNAETTLNELIHKSLNRQQLLTSIAKGSVYIRVDILNSFLYPENRIASDSTIQQKILENDQNHLEYQQLILDPYEQQLFDSVQLLRILGNKSDKTLTDIRNLDQNELSHLFEDFQRASSSLAEYVKKRDAIMIDEANAQLSAIETLNRGTTVALIVLLSLLGGIIARTVKIMRNKTLHLATSERKYRILTEQTNEIIVKCMQMAKLFTQMIPLRKD